MAKPTKDTSGSEKFAASVLKSDQALLGLKHGTYMGIKPGEHDVAKAIETLPTRS